MPMLDVTIPKEALSREAEAALLSKLTDLLILHEGADPSNAKVRQMAWVFLHRPEAVYVAGKQAEAPRYRLTVSVPQGQFDDSRRASMVKALTDAVLDAEEGKYPRDPFRVWVFPNEVPEGNWGAEGKIWKLADIAQVVVGDRAKAEEYARRRLNA